MEEIAFKNGFLCGLVSTGLGIGKCGKEDGSESTESSQLPKVDQMKVVNIEGFNPQGTYLKSDAYVVILSSTQDYIPKQGYVIIGGYMLMDMEGEVDFPQADIRVTVDDVLIFQGLDYEYFEDMCINPPQAFQFRKNFEVAARVLTRKGMVYMQLVETMVVGL